MVRLLLSAGADINLTTYSGKTVQDLAKSLEMKEFIKGLNTFVVICVRHVGKGMPCNNICYTFVVHLVLLLWYDFSLGTLWEPGCTEIIVAQSFQKISSRC